MIKAEVDGSGFLLLAAGCNAFNMGVALGVDGVAGLSDAGPSIAPAPLLDFFFFVMLSTKFGPFTTVRMVVILFSREYFHSFRDPRTESSGKTKVL